jgi:uncharacterized protein (TIGR03437 family)
LSPVVYFSRRLGMNFMQSQVRHIGIALLSVLIFFALATLPDRRQSEVSAAQCPPIAVAPGSIPGASLGQTYSQTFTASGGQSPYTFTRSTGALPPGLFLNSGGGLSGTPTATGNYNFTIQARDANNCTGSRSYSILVVCPSITLTQNLPGASLGVAYSQTITASGGASPYTFSRTAGALPPGLFLNSGGGLSGTPTATGNYNFTIQARDSNNCTGSRSYSMLVVCPGITLNPGSLPTATVGQSYSQNITATGGDSPYTFTVVSGSIPPGMFFGSSGAIGGTPNTAGTYNFLVRATDGNGCTGQRAITLTVVCGISLLPVTVPDATIGVPYFTLLSGSGGQTPYTYSIVSGVLPPGMSLTSSNGALAGTPTSTGNFSFTARVTDAAGCSTQRAYTIDVRCPENTITPGSFDVRVGASFSRTLNVTGGPGPHTFSFGPPGTPPSWLSISPSGVLSGTPTASGSFTFGVRAVDANGCAGAKNLTINVAACPTITINPATLPAGTAGTPYSQTFSANGGTSPYLFGTNISALPPGLTLNTNGTLSGTPTTAGSYSFIVRGNDSNGCFGERSYTLVINQTCPTITVNPPGILSGRVGQSYSWNFAANGGLSPYAFSLSAGTLPAGLTFAPNVISGIPTEAGSFPLTLRATDANGCIGERQCTLQVSCPTITLSPTSLPAGTTGIAYSQVVSATGGTAPYAFSIASGTLPVGISLAMNGTLSGTPTANGTYVFNLQASDAYGCTIVRTLAIVINNPTCQTITVNPISSTLPPATVGIAYSQTFTGNGGTSPYKFRGNGNIPPGLTPTQSGNLSGTPTTPGSYNFTVIAEDANGCTGERSYTLVINAPACPTITVNPASLPTGTTGAAYNQTLSATGGIAAYAFSITTGALPNGLSLTTNGALTGTPTVAGSYSFIVRATDANGCTGERGYTLVVNAPACPSITINQASLPPGIVGAAYLQTLTATGGVQPYSFSISGGNFPTDLMLNSTNGAILGTLTTAGTYNFTVRVTDINGCVGERSFTVVISTNLLTSVSAASFIAGDTLAPESIVASFGANLASGIHLASTTTLPTELGGVSLKVRDSAGVERLSQLFFVSPTQINHQMPAGMALGTAVVTVLNGANVVATGSIEITNVSPGLFSADASGRGLASAVALRVRGNGLQSFEPVARFDTALGKFVAEPIDVSNPLDQVFVVFYGTGWKLRSGLAAVSCSIGGVASEVLYAGEVPGFVGYDQLNVKLSPSMAGLGEVDVVITVDGKTANTLRVAFR